MKDKGVSSVIATTIIVAVTIALAIAVAYWLGGIAYLGNLFVYPSNETLPSEAITIHIGHDFLVINDWQFNGVVFLTPYNYLVIGTPSGDIWVPVSNDKILTFNYAQYYWKIKIIAFGEDIITFQILETNVK